MSEGNAHGGDGEEIRAEENKSIGEIGGRKQFPVLGHEEKIEERDENAEADGKEKSCGDAGCGRGI